MLKISRNTILQYIPNEFETEEIVNPKRIYEYNKKNSTGEKVIYLCERELRAKDNFALQFAKSKSEELNIPLKIIYPKTNYEYKPKQKFIHRQIEITKSAYLKSNIDFEIIENDLLKQLKMLNPAILILDFNPILNRDWIKYLNCKIYEIDSHNILPTRYASEEKEYSAATFRRKIYYGIYPFLTNYSNFIEYQSEADLVLEDFIQNKLERYAEDRNNPNKNVLSNLSKYLNLGFISSQRIAIDVIKSKVPEINKEVFLEELIVRKELADNFCHYCKDYKSLNCAYAWARNSLINHSQDLRKYIYSKNQLEKGETHDRLWNATQQQLIQEGKIHGYLRMYWAKKIMEWSLSAKEALETGIYLNDKYGYDAPSSNGYVGLLWAIAGIHDRAFMDFEVTGKIRRMSYNSLKKKIDVDSYIKTLTNKVTE